MKIRANNPSLTSEYGTGWKLTFDIDDESVNDVKRLIDRNPSELALEVKQYTRRRSLDANNYAWMLIGKIAVATRTDKMTVYRQSIRDLGDNYDFVCVTEKAADAFRQDWSSRGDGWLIDEVPCKIDGCRKFQIYYGSSVYDSHLMSAFIDRLVQDANDLGIDTLPRHELEELKKEWK